MFSPRLSPVRPTGARVGLQLLVPCSSPGGFRVLGRAGPRCEGSSQSSPLCADESFQLIRSRSRSGAGDRLMREPFKMVLDSRERL